MTDGNRYSVVVADDAEDIRQLVALIFEVGGRFEVVGEASSRDEVLDLAEAHKPSAILLDLNLASGSGLEVIPHVRKASPGTKILVFSGEAREQGVTKAMSAGADGYVQKEGSNLTALSRKLLQLIEG